MESGLYFLLYHLSFESEENVLSFKGFSETDWKQYKSQASDRLILEAHDILDWAYHSPDYDFSKLLQPAKEISNAAYYQYICRFRSSIEKFRTD